MIAANVIKPGRPVVWVWTAGLLRVSSRTDGSVNRSSLLLSTLSPYFLSAVPSAFEVVCSRPTDIGANLTNHAASFPCTRSRALASSRLPTVIEDLSSRNRRARTQAERHHDGDNATH